MGALAPIRAQIQRAQRFADIALARWQLGIRPSHVEPVGIDFEVVVHHQIDIALAQSTEESRLMMCRNARPDEQAQRPIHGDSPSRQPLGAPSAIPCSSERYRLSSRAPNA